MLKKKHIDGPEAWFSIDIQNQFLPVVCKIIKSLRKTAESVKPRG